VTGKNLGKRGCLGFIGGRRSRQKLLRVVVETSNKKGKSGTLLLVQNEVNLFRVFLRS